MSFFKKLFGSDDSDEQNVSKYTPDVKLPIEEEFVLNFQKNGGKFIFCDNLTELKEQFLNILQENDWFESEVVCFEPHLFSFLDENRLFYENVTNPKFHFSSCEGLLAEDGSILFTSNQLKHLKAYEINHNMVVICGVSKIIKNRHEGLRLIQKLYDKNLPNNITTFKSFINKNTESSDPKDFMNYGVSNKNLYLLVIED